MITRIEIGIRPDLPDPRGVAAARRIRDFLGVDVEAVRTRDVYLVDTELSDDERRRVLHELVDPVLQRGALGRLDGGEFDTVVAVGYKPGVTDPVGTSALSAVADTVGRALPGDAAVFTQRLWLLRGVDRDATERIARELLANPVIQSIDVATRDEFLGREPDLTVPRVHGREAPAVGEVDLSGDDTELERISRDGLLALDIGEMRAIRDWFAAAVADSGRTALGLGGRPTDVELECLAQTWSEHCKHKIFNATIEYVEDGRRETIGSLFDEYIRGATRAVDRAARERDGSSWLVSVFHDNAGVVTFDDEIHLVYKVETHNSPSALDPYGGAITGIVGVNRDPFGTGRGADLLANVWGYCFASPFHDGPLPRGLLHPRRIRDGVHEGVIDGGNQSGIPYGRGWELFDERFLGKPLVFCGTVGALPVTIAGRPGEEKAARPGDRIVMCGGRIGADGIHGATFSSAALDDSAPVQAVQIGDPITQKKMFDFLLEARAAGLYEAITDNGAGGLSSSVGEMARDAGGARLDLALAPLKYPGLAPWEILVSEAQERMTLAVAPERVDEFIALARRREVEAAVLGEFDDSGFLRVDYGDRCVARIAMEFLHDGAPEMRLEARWDPPEHPEPDTPAPDDLNVVLLDLLGRLNVTSNERKARHYDHEVKGLTVVKPWVGVQADVPAEATVFLARHGSLRGFVLSEGVNPFLSDLDGEAMARWCVDLAVRRQLCAGARLDRIALLDNFCWPDPVQSAHTPDGRLKLAHLVRACRGLRAAVETFSAPLVSGKDSMKNDSVMGGVKISVPPTLLVSAIGQIDDVRTSLTLEPHGVGDVVFLIGETRDECGGSEYYRWLGERDGQRRAPGGPQPWIGGRAPVLDLDGVLPTYRVVESAIRDRLIRAAAAPAFGGWATCFARVALAGSMGLELDVAAAGLAADRWLFSESGGRLLVTCAADRADELAARLDGVPFVRAGDVTSAPRILVRLDGTDVLDTPIASARRAFKGGLDV